jgi:hypothetical protein
MPKVYMLGFQYFIFLLREWPFIGYYLIQHIFRYQWPEICRLPFFCIFGHLKTRFLLPAWSSKKVADSTI